MLQLTKKINGCSRANHHTFLIFGLGLIGKAIAKELKQQATFQCNYLNFAWLDPLKQCTDIELIEEAILLSNTSNKNSPSKLNKSRITFIWSAGPCGFQASEDELNLELANFKNTVDFANKLTKSLPDIQFDFHMISSSGALFEGQRSVTVYNAMMPLRPYGKLKLEQELYLSQAEVRLGKCIYRPSSVYGNYDPNTRVGLIPIMLYNGIRNYTTEIYGDMNTIRDYIYVEDVSRFIVSECLLYTFSIKTRTHILASAKATSIVNIKHLVEAAIGRKIYLNYHLLPSVSAHNSFMPSALPSDMRITNLETGIRIIYKNLQQIL